MYTCVCCRTHATQIDAQKNASVQDATMQQPDMQKPILKINSQTHPNEWGFLYRYVNGKSIKNKDQSVRDEILQKWNAGLQCLMSCS